MNNPALFSESNTSDGLSRDLSLDIARGIGIISVVIGHIEAIKPSWLTFISAFHMPLFFIISGMLFRLKNEESREFLPFVKRKAKTLLLPYAILSVVDIVVYLLFCQVHYPLYAQPVPDPLPFLKNALMQTFTFYGMSVLWFLTTLFLAELIFLFIRKKTSLITTVIDICALTVVAYFGQTRLNTPDVLLSLGALGMFLQTLIRTVYATFFLMIGYLFAGFKRFINEKYRENIIKKNAVLCFVFGGILMALGARLGFINGGVDLRTLVIRLPYLYFSAAVLMSLGMLLICNAFARAADFFPFKILRFFGKESLTVMCTHLDWFLVYAGVNFANAVIVFYPVQALKLTVYTLTVTCFVLVLEVGLIYIKNRVKAHHASRLSSRHS